LLGDALNDEFGGAGRPSHALHLLRLATELATAHFEFAKLLISMPHNVHYVESVSGEPSDARARMGERGAPTRPTAEGLPDRR